MTTLADGVRDLLAAWDAFETDGPAPLDEIIERLRGADDLRGKLRDLLHIGERS